MKTFSQLRELTGRKPKGDRVFNKKIARINMSIHKEMGKFVVYIDGDRLDVYRNQKEAEKAGMTFIKQYKGIK